MTTIIMIFAFPIGIIFLIQEKKARVKYQAIFDDFYNEVNSDKTLTKDEKTNLYKNMLSQNQYQITTKNQDEIVAEKKIFSVGYLFIGIGTLYIGVVIYIIYYLYFQKPHVVKFIISQ